MSNMAQHEIDQAALPYAPDKLERKADVGADGFFALDLRTGRVTDVEPFPEARKPAWKLTVDFGPVVGTLRTSAQVTNYSADELRGRVVVGAINLGRKRIAGFTSEFLILGALDPNGTVRLLELPPGVGPGAPVA
jgi:tRNA-binding protein